MEGIIHEDLHLSIGNAGAQIRVIDKGHGPELSIGSNAYGNICTTMSILTNTTSLKELGEMLIRASEQKFSPVYCYPARSLTNVEFGSGECVSETPQVAQQTIFTDDEDRN